MRISRIGLFTLLIATFCISFACGGGETPSNQSNSIENAAASPEPSEDPIGGIESTPTPAERVEAVTLKPVVDAYCKAMREKDENGLRAVYSAATIRSFERDMQSEGIKTLVEFLSTEPVGANCGVVNERIQGNLGEANVTTETYPNGITLKFVKEGGSWKMTNQSSDFDAAQ